MDARTLTWLKPLKASPFHSGLRPCRRRFSNCQPWRGTRVNLTENRFGGTRDLTGCRREALRSVSSERDGGSPERRGNAGSDAETAPNRSESSAGRMAWQHVRPVLRGFRVGERGNTFVRSGESRRHRSRSLREAPGSPNPSFSWCDRPGVPGSVPMSFAASGSFRSTGDAPGPRRAIPRGWLAGTRDTAGTGLRRFRRFDEVREGQQWPPGRRRVIMAGRRSGGSPGRGRRGRVGPSGPSMEHGVRVVARRFGSADNVRRGRMAERSCRLRERNEPLKGEAQGRYRREIKPEGLREEQGARRLRKPEGAAQPGEASPVQVASRCLKRRRVNQPHEGSVVRRRLVSGHCAVRHNTVDHTLERSPSSREDGRCFAHPTEGSFGNTSKAGSQDQGHRGRNQPEGIYRRPEIL
jgi:hypothetical protein